MTSYVGSTLREPPWMGNVLVFHRSVPPKAVSFGTSEQLISHHSEAEHTWEGGTTQAQNTRLTVLEMDAKDDRRPQHQL